MPNIFSANAKVVSALQLTSLVAAFIGAFYVNFTFENLLIAFFGYFLYAIFGVSLTFHRFYSHKSFEFKNAFIENIALLFATLAGRGSSIGWTYVHRLHHTFSDQHKDPHHKSKTWRIFVPHLLDYGKNINLMIVRDLLVKKHIFLDKYYLLVIAAWVLLLSLVSIELLYFLYILPLVFSFLALDVFVFVSHRYGYKNFESGQDSKNNWLISLILFGEGWHNNHHANARRAHLKEKWWEVDLIGDIINIIKK